MVSRPVISFLLLFLFALLLRSFYGMTMFGGDDAMQVYLIGLKWYNTGFFPYWGPDVVYTQSQIPGALQGLLVGAPFFLKAVPEAPFFLLNLLTLSALCFLGWYLSQRIPAVPKWFLYIWLLTAPWAMNYATHVENPSYLLPAAIVFFVSVWEIFPIYEKQIIAAKWAFLGLGFSLFWIMQLHLSWVLMLPYIGLAFWFQAKKGKGFWAAVTFFLLGSACTASTLIPTFFEFGISSSGGTEQNISLNVRNLAEIPNVASKILSFACGEALRFMGNNTPERLDFLKDYPWAGPFTIFFLLAGLAQFLFFSWAFFQKKGPESWQKVKVFMLGSIGLVCLSYLFTKQPPKAHAFYLLFPVAIWYSFYCYGNLFKKKPFQILAIAFLLSGIIFHLALAQKNALKYGLWARRPQVVSALSAKDYTILGIRRESLSEMARWENVWAMPEKGTYRTGYEYQNPAYKPQNIARNECRNGQFSCKMDSILIFGGGFKEKMDLRETSNCQLTAFLKGDFGGEVLAVFEIKSNGKNVFWQSMPVGREMFAPNAWKKVELGFKIPETVRLGEEVMLYFWLSSKAGGSLFVDDMEVSFR